MDSFENLNNEQKEAVFHVTGPCLVLAGAGSGKTRVLTTRIAYLINKKNINSKNILAITFTNKAAKEMKERLYRLVPDNNAFIGTFHALGLKILRENVNKTILNNHFTILDSDDVLSVIKKIMKEKNIDPKVYSPYFIRNRISFIKNEMLNEKEISAFLNTPPEKVALSVYYEYEKMIHNNNSVDFDDLLVLPVRLFHEHKDVLDYYQELYKYILIDEYQDTNEVQYKLSKMLSQKYNNIFVVGDEDQSIYAFRNANYKNILNFEKDYKNCKVIKLEENYRSTNNILNAANCVIKNNIERKGKTLWSKNNEDIKVKYSRAYDEKHEVKLIIDEIKKLNEEGIEPKEIAILYRTNAQSRNVEEALLKNNIAYKVIGSYYFYQRKEIKDLISYLRLIQNPHDDISLRRVINVPKRKIGSKSISNLENLSKILDTSMFNAISEGKEKAFKDLILNLQAKAADLSLSETIEMVINESGLKDEYAENKTLDSDLKLDNLYEFISIASAYEERTGSASLDDFLEEITLISDMSEHKTDENAVNLMTIHSAKGLEFECVFLIGMEEGLFPHINSLMEQNLEEERRLCYVGITRAKRFLYITNAKRRLLYGKESINPPSRFITEIDEKYIDVLNPLLTPEEKVDKSKFYNKENNDDDFKVGDKINHDTYGLGVVVSTDKYLISVAFNKNIGVKKLLKNHKSIKKIGEK